MTETDRDAFERKRRMRLRQAGSAAIDRFTLGGQLKQDYAAPRPVTLPKVTLRDFDEEERQGEKR